MSSLSSLGWERTGLVVVRRWRAELFLVIAHLDVVFPLLFLHLQLNKNFVVLSFLLYEYIFGQSMAISQLDVSVRRKPLCMFQTNDLVLNQNVSLNTSIVFLTVKIK